MASDPLHSQRERLLQELALTPPGPQRTRLLCQLMDLDEVRSGHPLLLSRRRP